MIKQLYKKRGAVSLEALLSLGLLFFLLFFAWNIARSIYDVGLINNASQSAAQSTLQYFDRYATRNCSLSTNNCSDIANRAREKGEKVFERNYCTPGTRIDPIGFAGNNPCESSPLAGITILCAPRPTSAAAISSWGSCLGSSPANSVVVRAAVNPVQTSFAVLPGISFPVSTSTSYAYAWRVDE